MYYKQKFWKRKLGAEKKEKKVQNTVLLENTNEKDESEWRREVLHTCMNVYKRYF